LKVSSLAAAALALSPAGATVTFVKGAAYSQTQGAIGGNGQTVRGPDSEITAFSPNYPVSRSDIAMPGAQATVTSSSASAVSFDSVSAADFFVRTSIATHADAHGPSTYASATASALYDFSIDTQSILSFTAFTNPVSASPTANITVDLFSLDALGQPETYYRQAYFAGSGTLSYTLAPGLYSIVIAALSEGSTPANYSLAPGSLANATANMTLSILSPAAPVSDVPEPATWAMMVVGFGAIGTSVRARRLKGIGAAVGEAG
jgi:hypothetical protein